MVDFRSILVERMEYKDSILYLYCKTFYKVVENDYYRKYDYNVYHRKVLKFKNVKRFEYYLDEQIYNFVCELNDLQEELGIDYFSKIFYKSKKRNRLYIFERGYFEDFIMIEFKDDEKEKFEEKNIKLEVIEEKEDSYIINLKKVKRIATLSLRIPNSTRYYYIHYEEITNNFTHYDWYDEEYHTISEIAEQLNIILSRF